MSLSWKILHSVIHPPLADSCLCLGQEKKVNPFGRGRRDFSQPAWNHKELNHLNDVTFWAATKSGLTSLIENQRAPYTVENTIRLQL